MARLDVTSLATGGISAAVGAVALEKLHMVLPANSTTWGTVLSYAVPLAAGFGGAWFANTPGRMSNDIGQGVQAAGFTMLGMKLAREMIR